MVGRVVVLLCCFFFLPYFVLCFLLVRILVVVVVCGVLMVVLGRVCVKKGDVAVKILPSPEAEYCFAIRARCFGPHMICRVLRVLASSISLVT